MANIKESVITIGNFDGVHKGHQVLIGKTVEHAKKENIQSIVLLCFDNFPNPKKLSVLYTLTNSSSLSKLFFKNLLSSIEPP
ncbi:adenylyltransferase/cytidyltransferase family protein, partial [Clostridioides difficile]|uniref:adenylyltransferase/cytidyltransferase family protein n=1 Tax=Clostridioides difficile TaxID=1496 RepID=UPI001EEE589F